MRIDATPNFYQNRPDATLFVIFVMTRCPPAMKRILIILAAALLFSCAKKEGGYSVTIRFDGEFPEFKTDTRVVMFNDDPTESICDTTWVVKGIALFSGIISSPGMCSFRTIGIDPESGETRDFAEIFLENAVYTITVNQDRGVETDVAGGGEVQHVTDSLRQLAREIYRRTGIVPSFGTADTAAGENADSLAAAAAKEAAVKAAAAEVEAAVDSYIRNNPGSLFALYQIAQKVEYIGPDSAKRVLGRFGGEEYGNSVYVRKIRDYIDRRGALSEGEQAPDFEISAREGEPARFSDYYRKNRLTILHFWISSAPGNEKYNLILRKLYSKYHWKGLGIVSISADSDTTAFEEAVVRDRMWWPQGCDFRGPGSEAFSLYMVRTLPSTYIVDSIGRIVSSLPEEERIDPFLDSRLKVSEALYAQEMQRIGETTNE